MEHVFLSTKSKTGVMWRLNEGFQAYFNGPLCGVCLWRLLYIIRTFAFVTWLQDHGGLRPFNNIEYNFCNCYCTPNDSNCLTVCSFKAGSVLVFPRLFFLFCQIAVAYSFINFIRKLCRYARYDFYYLIFRLQFAVTSWSLSTNGQSLFRSACPRGKVDD